MRQPVTKFVASAHEFESPPPHAPSGTNLTALEPETSRLDGFTEKSSVMALRLWAFASSLSAVLTVPLLAGFANHAIALVAGVSAAHNAFLVVERMRVVFGAATTARAGSGSAPAPATALRAVPFRGALLRVTRLGGLRATFGG